MGFFSFARDERVVFIGLTVATISVVAVMRLFLEYSRDEAEVKPTQPTTQYITQDTEDSLKQSTLESLLAHHNYSIRETALRIVASRVANNKDAVDELLWGITRPDYAERAKCLKALQFVIEDVLNQDPLLVLHNAKGYSALVRSLELSLDDREHEPLDDPLHDEYWLRDINERRCLIILCQMVIKYGVVMLLDAKFVQKWLAKQKWGDTDKQRQSSFQQYVERKKNRISIICEKLRETRLGHKALRQAKLVGKHRYRPGYRSDSRVKVILEINMANDDGEGEIQQETSEAELVPRVLDQTAEEQRRRRRHREAIVLNDGTHSLGRGDIIEREHDSNS